MAANLAGEAQRARKLGDLTERDIARATGVSAVTARAWLSGTRQPTGERSERLIELTALVERLAQVMPRDYIAVWLRKPQVALDDDKPLDVIAAGDYRRVSALIASLETFSVS